MTRPRTPPILRFLDRVVALPWWLSACLAVLAFVALGSAADRAAAIGESTAFPAGVLIVAARIGQVLLSLLFLFAAAAAIGQRLKSGTVVASSGGAGRFTAAAGRGALSWAELEALVSAVYERQGYDVERAGRGRDGGVELVLRRGRERFLVQCRHWQPAPIGADAIRELADVIAASRAKGGALVTLGSFTSDAVEVGRRKGIELIGGSDLDRLGADGLLDTDRREPI